MALNSRLVANLLSAVGSSSPQKAKVASQQLDAVIFPNYRRGKPKPTIITIEQARRIDEEHFERIRGTPVVDLLVGALSNTSPATRCYAVGALACIGDDRTLPHLLASLNDPDSNVRAKAASFCTMFKDQCATGPLIHALFDTSDEVVRSAARSLGDLRALDALPRLVELAASDNWTFRKSAVTSLGDIASRSTLPLVRNALKDKHRAVRKAAKSALANYDIIRRKKA